MLPALDCRYVGGYALMVEEMPSVMQETTPFAEVLDAAAKLTLPEQEELVDILHRRALEQRRAQIVEDVVDAEREFASGGCRPVDPDELMKDILS
jgi:hypothetical protein